MGEQIPQGERLCHVVHGVERRFVRRRTGKVETHLPTNPRGFRAILCTFLVLIERFPRLRILVTGQPVEDTVVRGVVVRSIGESSPQSIEAPAVDMTDPDGLFEGTPVEDRLREMQMAGRVLQHPLYGYPAVHELAAGEQWIVIDISAEARDLEIGEVAFREDFDEVGVEFGM
jgi:hypothetical protein